MSPDFEQWHCGRTIHHSVKLVDQKSTFDSEIGLLHFFPAPKDAYNIIRLVCSHSNLQTVHMSSEVLAPLSNLASLNTQP